MVNKEKTNKKSKETIPAYNEHTMTTVRVSGLLVIDAVEIPVNRTISPADFRKILSNYISPYPEVEIDLVYCDKYKYYIPAITNMSIDYDDDRLCELEASLTEYLEQKSVIFC